VEGWSQRVIRTGYDDTGSTDKGKVAEVGLEGRSKPCHREGIRDLAIGEGLVEELEETAIAFLQVVTKRRSWVKLDGIFKTAGALS